jgi:hypothetical protein
VEHLFWKGFRRELGGAADSAGLGSHSRWMYVLTPQLGVAMHGSSRKEEHELRRVYRTRMADGPGAESYGNSQVYRTARWTRWLELRMHSTGSRRTDATLFTRDADEPGRSLVTAQRQHPPIASAVGGSDMWGSTRANCSIEYGCGLWRAISSAQGRGETWCNCTIRLGNKVMRFVNSARESRLGWAVPNSMGISGDYDVRD